MLTQITPKSYHKYAIDLELLGLTVYLHFTSSEIWNPAYIIDEQNSKNQVIRFVFDDDNFAIWTSPPIDVSLANLTRLSTSFIFLQFSIFLFHNVDRVGLLIQVSNL